MVGRLVLRDQLVVVAPPGWERPEPTAAGTAAKMPAVARAIGDVTQRWVVEDDGRQIVIDPQPVLRLLTLIIRDAVSAGAGVALFPSFFVRGDIAEGRVASWGTLVGDPLEFWVLHASSRLVSSKVRAFTDMFTIELGRR